MRCDVRARRDVRAWCDVRCAPRSTILFPRAAVRVFVYNVTVRALEEHTSPFPYGAAVCVLRRDLALRRVVCVLFFAVLRLVWALRYRSVFLVRRLVCGAFVLCDAAIFALLAVPACFAVRRFSSYGDFFDAFIACFSDTRIDILSS